MKVCIGGSTTCVRPTDVQMPGLKFGTPEIIPRRRKGGSDVHLMAAEESVLKEGCTAHLFVCSRAS